MAGERKFTCYQDAVNLAHELAAKEPEALPPYQQQALGYRRYLSDVLGDEVNSLKDALQFMRDFSLCCDDRSVRDKRVKDKQWKDIYNTFFTILDVNPKNPDGKKWSLKTVKTACDMVYGTNMQDFFTALDESHGQVHEFLKEVEASFVKEGYLKKAS